MAELPDLPTNNVALMAYYNILDNTNLNAIDPTDAVNAANINGFTQYDNGITATFTYGRGADFLLNARVKTDGWIVVWLDDQLTYNDKDESPYTSRTFHEFWTNPVDGEFDPPGIYDSNLNVITILQDIFTELEAGATNSGSFTASDTNYYSYTADSATTIDLINYRNGFIQSSGQSEITMDVSYPSTVTPVNTELALATQDTSGNLDHEFDGVIYAESKHGTSDPPPAGGPGADPNVRQNVQGNRAV